MARGFSLLVRRLFASTQISNIAVIDRHIGFSLLVRRLFASTRNTKRESPPSSTFQSPRAEIICFDLRLHVATNVSVGAFQSPRAEIICFDPNTIISSAALFALSFQSPRAEIICFDAVAYATEIASRCFSLLVRRLFASTDYSQNAKKDTKLGRTQLRGLVALPVRSNF